MKLSPTCGWWTRVYRPLILILGTVLILSGNLAVDIHCGASGKIELQNLCSSAQALTKIVNHWFIIAVGKYFAGFVASLLPL
jgi:hypothetical protein